jgi:hypothetical protein
MSRVHVGGAGTATERAPARLRLTHVKSMVRDPLHHARSLIVCGVLLSTAAVTASCASASGLKTNCGADVVYLERNGTREGLLNCAGVAVGTPVKIRVGETATARMLKAALPSITSSNSNVLATHGDAIRGVATGVVDLRISASTLCGSDTMVVCTLARVAVSP